MEVDNAVCYTHYIIYWAIENIGGWHITWQGNSYEDAEEAVNDIWQNPSCRRVKIVKQEIRETSREVSKT